MQRNLRRILNAGNPKNPKSAESVRASFENEDVMENYGYNLRRSESFYMGTLTEKKKSSPCSFSLFGSKEVINMIEEHIKPEERKYLLDGTFDTSPVGFYQLLIIYIEYKNDVSIHPSIHPSIQFKGVIYSFSNR